MPPQRRFRRAVFTLNNYTAEEENQLKDAANQLRYLIYGRENAPTTGTKHLQGYAAGTTLKTIEGWKLLLGRRCHIEMARGSETSNIRYCSKEGETVEFGTPNAQGTRSDLQMAVQTLMDTKDNCPIQSVAESHPTTFIRYSRGIRDLASTLRLGTERKHRTQLIIVWGYPGTGKSYTVRRAAAELEGEDETFSKSRGEWWDGYSNHKSVILDDYYGWLKWDELLKIADQYPYRVPIKGGFVPFTANRIYITSNKHPEDWYKFQGYDWTALKRRCDILVHLPEPGQTQVKSYTHFKISDTTDDIKQLFGFQ